MIKPYLQDEAFIAEVRKVSKIPEQMHLWWLGQSGFLVQWRDAHLLIDPYLSDSLTRKYTGTDKPHVRMTGIVIEPEKLDFIDVVTSSHNHTDHLDGETIIPLLRVSPGMAVIVPEANRLFASDRLGVPPMRLTGIVQGQDLEVGSFRFHAVPAAHESLVTDTHGNHKYIGLVIQAGPYTIYHSGDTVRYEGMAEILSQWQIDIALLPINGRDPARGVAGNLSGMESARLAKDIAAKLVIPCHYDMFTFNTVKPDKFIEAAERLGQPYRLLRNGKRYSVPVRE